MSVAVVMDREWLEARFGSESSPGWSAIRGGDQEEQTFRRTGGPVALCWAWADEVVAEFGAERAVRTGYHCRPGSHALIAGHADGHDLAIVDGRFIVDGWLAFVIGEGPCILDLADPAERAAALRIHEPFALWDDAPAIIQPATRRAA